MTKAIFPELEFVIFRSVLVVRSFHPPTTRHPVNQCPALICHAVARFERYQPVMIDSLTPT